MCDFPQLRKTTDAFGCLSKAYGMTRQSGDKEEEWLGEKSEGVFCDLYIPSARYVISTRVYDSEPSQ